MRTLPGDDVALLIAHLRQQLAEPPDFLLQWIGWGFCLGYVDDAVDVEGDFFGIGAPVLVAKAVCVLAVGTGGERMVPGGDLALMDEVGVVAIEDLNLSVRSEPGRRKGLRAKLEQLQRVAREPT